MDPDRTIVYTSGNRALFLWPIWCIDDNSTRECLCGDSSPDHLVGSRDRDLRSSTPAAATDVGRFLQQPYFHSLGPHPASLPVFTCHNGTLQWIPLHLFRGLSSQYIVAHFYQSHLSVWFDAVLRLVTSCTNLHPTSTNILFTYSLPRPYCSFFLDPYN